MGSHEHSLLSNKQNSTSLKNKAEIRMQFTVINCCKFLLLQYSQMYYIGTKCTGIYLVLVCYITTGTYLALKLQGNVNVNIVKKL
jgi:hypothetical protein